MKDESTIADIAPQCRDAAALLASSALGSELAADERARLEEHLATCPFCRERAREYAGLAQILSLSVAEARPPQELRAKIVAAARRHREPGRRGRPWGELLRFPQGWQRVAALALAPVAALLIVLGLWQQAEIGRLRSAIALNQSVAKAAFGNEDKHESQLQPAGAAADATGKVWVSPGEPAVVMYAKNLQPLAAGQVYQLWLLGGAQTVGVGTFTPDSEGRAWLVAQPPQPLGPPARVFVTVEPAGGSAQPTGPEYLMGGFDAEDEG